MEQTAVGLALELIKKDYQVNGKLRLAYVMQVLEQAKEMEKQKDAKYNEILETLTNITEYFDDKFIEYSMEFHKLQVAQMLIKEATKLKQQ